MEQCHADMMFVLCTHNILCMPVTAIITLSLYIASVKLETYPDCTLYLIFLNDNMQYMLSKYLAVPGIALGRKRFDVDKGKWSIYAS